MAVDKMIEQTSVRYDRLLKRLTAPLLQHFGIHYFCYQFVSNDGHWFNLGNNPEWLLYSAGHQFYQFDPSLVSPSCYSASSICMPQLQHQNQEFQQTLVEHAIDLFDLAHCLALINPTSDGCEYYFFSAPKAHYKIMSLYITQLNKLRFEYTRYVKSQMQSITKHCFQHAVNLYEINSNGFNPTDSKLVIENPTQGLAFLSDIKDIPRLTTREYQCLELYQQQGLTSKQIAKKFGISYRTIEGHFDNIKLKYQVFNKRDLLNEPFVSRSQYAYLDQE